MILLKLRKINYGNFHNDTLLLFPKLDMFQICTKKKFPNKIQQYNYDC